MLNPSVADENQDDPTIRKCIGFTDRGGYHGFTVVNVFAIRSTDPRGLLKVADPVGPDNLLTIERMLNQKPKLVVCAWGNPPSGVSKMAFERVLKLVMPYDPRCLGRTKSGQPRHPLMLSYETKLERFAA